MTFELPAELEQTIRAAVQGGRFANLDEAMTAAARLLVHELTAEPTTTSTETDTTDHDPILGLFRNDAALMDEIVADAYRLRRTVDVE